MTTRGPTSEPEAPGPAPLRYAPARWLRGAHAMTVFASVVRVFPRPRAQRERWELPDGDFVDVDRFIGDPD